MVNVLPHDILRFDVAKDDALAAEAAHIASDASAQAGAEIRYGTLMLAIRYPEADAVGSVVQRHSSGSPGGMEAIRARLARPVGPCDWRSVCHALPCERLHLR